MPNDAKPQKINETWKHTARIHASIIDIAWNCWKTLKPHGHTWKQWRITQAHEKQQVRNLTEKHPINFGEDQSGDPQQYD